MDQEKVLRKLARSDYWQFLYRQSKEFNDLSILFENTNNLSAVQLRMLFWLERYHNLYEDLAMKTSIYLDQSVIDNDVRCDAYLYKKYKDQEAELVKQRDHKEAENFRGNKGKIPEEMHQIRFVRGE